jgi:hypothetical protein
MLRAGKDAGQGCHLGSPAVRDDDFGEGKDGESLSRLGLGARIGHLPSCLYSKRLLIMGLALGQLPAQDLLDTQTPDLMNDRAHVRFAQLGAGLGPAPPELGEHWGTRP